MERVSENHLRTILIQGITVTRRIAPFFLLACLPAAAVAQGDSSQTAQRDTTPLTLPTIEVKGAARPAYLTQQSTTATKTSTPLRDVPQSVTIISKSFMADQRMQSMGEVTRYVPGITMGQGEGNRDQPTIRGNNTTAGFFVNGMRDDVRYFRDLYNVERVEALKGANALIFGRGVGGGVLNRVTKVAEWTPTRELSLQGGSYGNRRTALDVGQGISKAVALRLNGVFENSDVYRDEVNIERYGINPTATIELSPQTRVLASYEHFNDDRTADRGIPSYAGAPLSATTPRTFFGDPALSWSDALVNIGTASIEHTTAGRLTLRNRSVFADYDKFYQNVFPGAVNPAGTEVNISAYNDATQRRNLFNESEVSYRLKTGAISQTLLGGFAIGRQITDNFRNTGYFYDSATTVTAPVSNPTIAVPVTFRQSATDADNHSTATSLSFYGQSQVVLSEQWQAIVGARYEHFDVDFHNRRTNEALTRSDDLVSPRAALLFKPAETVTLYSSYSVSALPSSGDQFSSMTVTTATLEPEKFRNYEIGAKWDVLDRLSLASAVYRLDRQPAHQRIRVQRHRCCDARLADHRRVCQSECRGHQPDRRGPGGSQGSPGAPEHRITVEPLSGDSRARFRSGRGLSGRHVRRHRRRRYAAQLYPIRRGGLLCLEPPPPSPAESGEPVRPEVLRYGAQQRQHHPRLAPCRAGGSHHRVLIPIPTLPARQSSMPGGLFYA
jgi:catecholate siderophore receptor